ncbi:hypothetical protein [Streptomyces sp. NPDC046261]|uniref:hypothetical protein n=1 Tax=Streptomyces sp. NPDC046261 TaxID=3157200 RepID=UPI003409C0C2
MFRKRGLGVALCSLALIGAAMGWAPATQAHTPISCTGDANTSYSPGLRLTPQRISVQEGVAYTCTTAPGRVTAATSHIVGESPGGTCLAFHAIRARETVRYGDGSTSVIFYNTGRATRVLGVNTVRLAGIVVSGRGQGGHAERVMQVTPAGTPAACVTREGIQSSNGQVQMRILP